METEFKSRWNVIDWRYVFGFVCIGFGLIGLTISTFQEFRTFDSVVGDVVNVENKVGNAPISIMYRYVVNDIPYLGEDSLPIGDRVGGLVGSSLRVHYSVSDPSNSTIYKPLQHGPIFIFFGVLLLFGVFLVFIRI